MKQAVTIGIVGGTGQLGSGLALRWLTAGHAVVVGSRDQTKAEQAKQDLTKVLTERGVNADKLSVATNEQAAEQADVVVLTVPYSHHALTLESIKPLVQNKILIDVTVPLRPPKVGTVQLPEAGSAAQEAQQLLGDDVRVVSAFQNVAAHHLQHEQAIDCDVLVAGNDKQAREQVVALVNDAGMTGFSVGPIANAAAAEALTSVLIQLNRQFKCHAGIRISGLPS